MIKVVPFIYEDLDDLYANTYVLVDDDKNCVVIDPAKAYQGLINYINKNGLTLKGVLLTHGHIDHMRGVDILIDAFKCPLFIGFYDIEKLTNPYDNCSLFIGGETIINAKADTVSDNQILKCFKEDIAVIETPFHTSGSVCYFLADSKLLFTGDFLFAGSIGRSDLPTAQPKEFKKSISKILALPKETKVYPGHGPFTSIDQELKVNPFVK